jgi:hypothetical protein
MLWGRRLGRSTRIRNRTRFFWPLLPFVTVSPHHWAEYLTAARMHTEHSIQQNARVAQ